MICGCARGFRDDTHTYIILIYEKQSRYKSKRLFLNVETEKYI